MGTLKSIIDILNALAEKPIFIPIIISIGIVMLCIIIVSSINKLNRNIDIRIESIGNKLNETVKERIEYFRTDIAKIKECNEDLLIMRPMIKDIYDHREMFDNIFKTHEKRKDDIKINTTKLQPDIDYTGR